MAVELDVELGIVGGGVMGEALLSRAIAKKIYAPGSVLVSDPIAERRETLQSRYGVRTTGSNQEVTAAKQVLLLAVKPQIFEIARQQIEFSNLSNTPPVVLSIMAGIDLARLEAAFPGIPVVRSMPNTPAQVGVGITAIAPGTHVRPEHLAAATRLLESVGDVVRVSEPLLDAVTGLSGSGPGYVAIAVEALTDGGVAAGLPRAIAQKLALQTVRGTAELLHQTQMHPAELKDRVTSPGGTTIAGIACLEARGFRSALIEAVKAASDRSRELGS